MLIQSFPHYIICLLVLQISEQLSSAKLVALQLGHLKYMWWFSAGVTLLLELQQHYCYFFMIFTFHSSHFSIHTSFSCYEMSGDGECCTEEASNEVRCPPLFLRVNTEHSGSWVQLTQLIITCHISITVLAQTYFSNVNKNPATKDSIKSS